MPNNNNNNKKTPQQQHPDGGERKNQAAMWYPSWAEEACGRIVCVWSSSQPNRAAQRNDSANSKYLPKRGDEPTNTLGNQARSF